MGIINFGLTCHASGLGKNYGNITFDFLNLSQTNSRTCPWKARLSFALAFPAQPGFLKCNIDGSFYYSPIGASKEQGYFGCYVCLDTEKELTHDGWSSHEMNMSPPAGTRTLKNNAKKEGALISQRQEQEE